MLSRDQFWEELFPGLDLGETENSILEREMEPEKFQPSNIKAGHILKITKDWVYAHNGKKIADAAQVRIDDQSRGWLDNLWVIPRSQYLKSDYCLLDGTVIPKKENFTQSNGVVTFKGQPITLVRRRKYNYAKKNSLVFAESGMPVPATLTITRQSPVNYRKDRPNVGKRLVNGKEVITLDAFLRRNYVFADDNTSLTCEEKKAMVYDEEKQTFHLNERRVVYFCKPKASAPLSKLSGTLFIPFSRPNLKRRRSAEPDSKRTLPRPGLS